MKFRKKGQNGDGYGFLGDFHMLLKDTYASVHVQSKFESNDLQKPFVIDTYLSVQEPDVIAIMAYQPYGDPLKFDAQFQVQMRL